jgi:hypothetical protein
MNVNLIKAIVARPALGWADTHPIRRPITSAMKAITLDKGYARRVSSR